MSSGLCESMHQGLFERRHYKLPLREEALQEASSRGGGRVCHRASARTCVRPLREEVGMFVSMPLREEV